MVSRGRAIYAKLGLVQAPETAGRTLIPLSAVSPEPTLGLFRPQTRTHPEKLVTGSALDSLSVSVAGYRSLVSTFQGLMPWPRQTWATKSLPTPWRAAIDLVDHCVEPLSGTDPTVSATIASITGGSTRHLRPRPGAIDATDATPPARHLAGQRRTVLGYVPRPAAVAPTDDPSARASNGCAGGYREVEPRAADDPDPP